MEGAMALDFVNIIQTCGHDNHKSKAAPAAAAAHGSVCSVQLSPAGHTYIHTHRQNGSRFFFKVNASSGGNITSNRRVKSLQHIKSSTLYTNTPMVLFSLKEVG